MNKKIEDLINNELDTHCPKCGESMITLSGMKLLKESSRWEYHTFYKRCLSCSHSSNSVKIHGKFIHKVEREASLNKSSEITDITPPKYGESILKRLIRWISPSNEVR